MGEFTCLVGLNRARIFLEFGWPQWGKSMSERAEKAEALAARIKPILAGNDPDIKGKRRRSFLPAPQRLSPCQRGQCPAGGGLKASAGRLKVALDAAPARTLSSEEKREPDRKDGRERKHQRARGNVENPLLESLGSLTRFGLSIPAICP